MGRRPERERDNNYMSSEQRAELHEILHYILGPCSSPGELLKQRAIMCFLNCQDPIETLVSRGIPRYQAVVARSRAYYYLNGLRDKRRRMAAEIRRKREADKKPRFTYQNFSVTMDHADNTGLGASTMSIFALVEVFQEDEEFEKEFLVNYSDYDTKEWLIKTLVWSLMNKREVVIKPATEEDMKKRLFTPRKVA